MSKPLPPSRTAPQFVIRFPDEDLREHIKQAAEKNNRSMNAEIIARLQASLGVAEAQPHATPAEIAASLGLMDDSDAERVADKVVERLTSSKDFMRQFQRILLDLDKDGKSSTDLPKK